MFIKRLTQTGDTIVEVLIATVIISSVMVGAYAVTNSSFTGVRRSEERGWGLQIMQDQFETLRSQFIAQNSAIIQAMADGTQFCVTLNSSPVPPFRIQVVGTPNDCQFTNTGYPNTVGAQPSFLVRITKNPPSTKQYTFNGVVSWDQAGGGTESVTIQYRVQP